MRFLKEFHKLTLDDMEEVFAEFEYAKTQLIAAGANTMRAMTLIGRLLGYLAGRRDKDRHDISLSLLAYTPEILAVMGELKNILRLNTDIVPGENITQSFLFDNYPGVHYNFICREFTDRKPTSDKVRVARSAERRLRAAVRR